MFIIRTYVKVKKMTQTYFSQKPFENKGVLRIWCKIQMCLRVYVATRASSDPYSIYGSLGRPGGSRTK
jgi:hypothetical protein